MQGGYLDKAQKYTDKALIQIEKLRSKKGKVYLINGTINCKFINHFILNFSVGASTDSEHVSSALVGADNYV